MPARKNIFRIGRKGHVGDENQLTEMLAYLLQEERHLVGVWLTAIDLDVGETDGWMIETQRSVPSGFLDLVLFVPGKAIVIVESKLGSTTDFPQISKYVEYAKSIQAPALKALVFMPQQGEHLPAGIEEFADDRTNPQKKVVVLERRWQTLGDALRNTDSPLANDFVEMLEHENLVTPNPITADDWLTWSEGNRVSRHLATLLTEAGEAVGACAPSLNKINAVSFWNSGAIARGFDFEDLSLYVGFWPTRKWTQPAECALVTVYVLNKRLPVTERKAAGQAAVDKAASSNVAMSGWGEYHVERTVPAPLALDGPDFETQCDRLVDEVTDALEFFRGLGYLDPA